MKIQAFPQWRMTSQTWAMLACNTERCSCASCSTDCERVSPGAGEQILTATVWPVGLWMAFLTVPKPPTPTVSTKFSSKVRNSQSERSDRGLLVWKDEALRPEAFSFEQKVDLSLIDPRLFCNIDYKIQFFQARFKKVTLISPQVEAMGQVRLMVKSLGSRWIKWTIPPYLCIGTTTIILTGFGIYFMSIVDILEIQTCVIGVSDTGHAILWDLSEIKQVNGAYIFKDNISLLPSRAALRIDPHRLTGLRRHHNTLIMFNQQTIYVLSFEQILQAMREERLKNIVTINTAAFFEKKELINCLEASSDHVQTILIGTNKGNLYTLDYKQNVVISSHSLGKDPKENTNEITNFATTVKQVHEVNSIALYNQKEYLLAGLSNGKAYCLRTQNLERVFQLTQKTKQTLESITKIVFSRDGEKAYFLHQNYITEWSIKLGACLSYIEYSHPVDLFAKGNCINIIGNHSKLIWYDNAQKECKLSMRSARTIKELGAEHLAVGGSDGIIDILIGGMRLMTLFHR